MKLRGLVGGYQCLGVAILHPSSADGRILVKNGTRIVSHPTGHGFSNCGMPTTSGTPTSVYQYAASIKNQNTKQDRHLSK
jgi:hypothetical protein